jgi:predicted AAA+ superfamily ATPase
LDRYLDGKAHPKVFYQSDKNLIFHKNRAKTHFKLVLAQKDAFMYISHDLEVVLVRYAKFPAIALLGPRQSGKTTLARKVFPRHQYVSFENYHERFLAADDPKGFLKKYENEYGILIDEFQYIPLF